MEKLTAEEIEIRLNKALEMRKQAYRLRCPKYVTADLNRSIRGYRDELANRAA